MSVEKIDYQTFLDFCYEVVSPVTRASHITLQKAKIPTQNRIVFDIYDFGMHLKV